MSTSYKWPLATCLPDIVKLIFLLYHVSPLSSHLQDYKAEDKTIAQPWVLMGKGFTSLALILG